MQTPQKLYPIPSLIALAIACYYLNRDKTVTVEQTTWKSHMKDSHYVAYPSGYVWDKAASLKMIKEACAKFKWSFSASAGTFWLSNKTHLFTVDEKTFPLATRTKRQFV